MSFFVSLASAENLGRDANTPLRRFMSEMRIRLGEDLEPTANSRWKLCGQFLFLFLRQDEGIRHVAERLGSRAGLASAPSLRPRV